MAKTEYLHIRIDSELKARLQEKADAERRTVSNFIELLILKALDEQD